MPGPITVLLVEDDDLDAVLVERLLQRSGGPSIHVRRAKRLAECLSVIPEGGFDVILLDLGLPDAEDGIGALQAVHRADGQIPIVVLTGLADEEIAMLALREGAQDYVVKEGLGSQNLTQTIRYAVERVLHTRSERRLRDAEDQFRAAREIQQSLFPASKPDLFGYDLAALCRPADATGGDYFDFFPMKDGHIGLVIGDVSGHGIGPAMMMTATRAVLRTLVRSNNDPSKIIGRLNEILLEDTPVGHFVTLLIARLNVKDGSLLYSSAGHDGYILDSKGDVKHELEAQGLPLNIWQGDYETPPLLTLEPGDSLFLYTDGITEAHNRDNQMFGCQRMLGTMRANYDLSAQEMIDGLFDASTQFRDGTPQTDDMTSLLLKRH